MINYDDMLFNLNQLVQQMRKIVFIVESTRKKIIIFW